MKKFTKKLLAGFMACATLIVSLPSPERVWADEPAVVTEQPAENPGQTTPDIDETVLQSEPEEPYNQGESAQLPESDSQTEEVTIQDEEEVPKVEAVMAEPEAEEPEETGEIYLETKTEGVTVKVEAEAGTFPEDVKLVAESVDTDVEEEATAAVDEVRDENVNVAA